MGQHEEQLKKARLREVYEELGVEPAYPPAVTKQEEELATKFCRYCRSEIPRRAVKCPCCSEWLIERERDRKFNWPAAILSFFVPGLGQMAFRSVGSGAYWFFGALLGYLLLVVPGVAVHVWSVIDAGKGE